MPLINSIPERYEEGFTELGILEDLEFEQIEQHLQNTPLVSSIKKLSETFENVEGLDLQAVEEILLSVGSLTAFIESTEFIKVIVSDIIAICERDTLIKAEDIEKFEKRLNFLLNNEQIYYASKAETLTTNYGNIYILSRAITDIRPVFDINVDIAPKAGLILHNLSIHYQSNDEPFHKDISLVLTAEDIRNLKDVLDRAEQKEIGLQSMLKNSGMKNLND